MLTTRWAPAVLALGAFVFGTQPGVAGPAEEIEEVVVTGSYLKRTSADSPSPLSIVTAADIADIGAADVAEIVQTLPWQSGSQTRASTFQGEGADGRNTINLRNLGHGATLVLVNGKRGVRSWYNPRGNASVNINALMPNIAIERLEIVKDGAAALYGSDAIAGVVNFITDQDFEGFDLNYQFTTDDETGEGDTNRAELKFGVQGDRGGIVVSAGLLKRKEINVDDRYDRFGGSTASSTGQPGRLKPLAGQTIVWAANGLNPGQPVGTTTGGFGDTFIYPRDPQGTSFGEADVDCENAAAEEQGGALGPVFANLICAYDFGSFFSLQSEESLRQFYVTGNYQLTDQLTTHFEFGSTDSRFDRLNSLNPNAPALTIPTTHPGSIEDAFRRGIEPILVSNLTRLVGQTRNSPDRPLSTFTNTHRADQRIVVGASYDFQFMDRDWTLDVSATSSEHASDTSQVQDTLSSHMELAINGLGGPECDVINGTPGEGNLAFAASGGDFNAGQCYYFNPFGSSRFARDGTRQTDLSLVNPQGLYDWLAGRITSDTNYRERDIDLLLTGSLIDMPSGPLQIAAGFQRRRETGEVVLDAAANTGNLDFAFGAKDWRGDLTTLAGFIEVGIPVHSTLDINVAGRYESFDEIDENTFDPKVTLLWRPRNDLSVRASYGTAFKIPSLLQLFGSLTTVANQTDFGGDSAFRPSITPGNVDLKPEDATTYNIGLSWAPQDNLLEGFQIDIDFYDYNYEDIITRQDSANLLQADNAALQAFIDANPGASLVDALAAGAGNRRQILRNPQGVLLRILPDFENADSADIRGLDYTLSYRFSSDRFGLFRLGFQGTWVVQYDVKSGGQTFDGVGQYNQFTPVARPLPEYKFNATLNWSRGPHSFFALIQHVPEIDYGIDLATDPRGGAARFWNQTVALALGPGKAADFFTRDIDAFTTDNVSYTYDFGERGPLADSRVTLGIQNVANAEPPWVPVITGYDGTLHDPRGRIWFARVSASL